MHAAISTLSVRQTLRGSLPFLKEFVSKHWILVTIYCCLAVISHLIFDPEQGKSGQLFLNWKFYLWWIIVCVPSWLIMYYAIKMSLTKLAPDLQSNKPFLQFLWQIICLDILRFVIIFGLSLLLLIPAIWWLTKTSICSVVLLSAENGPIQSIIKSHELINNKFWLCFKYWFGAFTIVILCVDVPLLVLVGIYAICMYTTGHGLSAQSFGHIFNLLNSGVGVFMQIVLLFCETWLYVYLKQNNTVSATTA